MKLSLFVTAALLSTVILISCNKDNPVPPGEQPQINLTLEDVSCTEAWLKLTTANISLPANVEILKDDNPVKTISLTSADTILYIDSLLPKTSYSFSSIIQSNNQSITSPSLPVITMDTTSHNLTWQSWTFGGEAGGCVLYDVAIIDQNDIWAVGEIYLLDTLGQPDPNAYNAVHWNGNDWELLRLQFYTFCGQPSAGSYPAKSILALNEHDIWITSGSQVTHFDGTNQLSTECIPVSVNNLWGTDNNIYAVGKFGKIAHYQNRQWSRIESGTTTIIQDIWGSDGLILCTISNVASPGDKKILEINNNQVSDFLWDTGRRVQSIWYKNKNAIYTCGGGVFSLKDGIHWNEITEIPLIYSESIRGSDYNNIWVAGDFGLLAHFNGLRWKVFNEPTADIYYACAVKGNIIVAAGTKGGKAIISYGSD